MAGTTSPNLPCWSSSPPMTSGGTVATRRPLALDWNAGVTALLMVALIAPVVVVPGIFFPYVVPRNILFRVAVEIAAAVCLIEILFRRKRLELRREYVLLALGLFVLVITVSALFSPARTHSLFGDFERMGGVWAWLHLAVFALVLRTVDEGQLAWLLRAALAVCVGASVHAIIGRVSGAGSLTIAGNAGLFAGYALVGIGVALYLAIERAKYRPVYLIAAAIEVAALLVTENRSSVLGLLVGASAGAVLLATGAPRAKRPWTPVWLALGAAGLSVAVVAVVRVSGSGQLSKAVPGALRRIAATDFAGIDALRAIQWDAALAGFRDRPLLGFGPENYQLVWSAHFDPRSQQLGAEVFDRAHNQYLEVLATTGIAGALAFLAIWAAIAYSLRRAFVARRLNAGELAVLGGANTAYAAYLIFWFVDMNAAILWILLAALIARRSNPAPILRSSERPPPRSVAAGAAVITVATLAFVLHRHAYVPIRVSIALATLDSREADEEEASVAVRTISTSTATQTSHFGPVLSGFVAAAVGAGTLDATRRERRPSLLDAAFETGISAFEAELRRDPLNDRLHTSAAELLIDAAEVYGSPAYLERAIELLERAVELSPRRSRQRRILAQAYTEYSLLAEQAGR